MAESGALASPRETSGCAALHSKRFAAVTRNKTQRFSIKSSVDRCSIATMGRTVKSCLPMRQRHWLRRAVRGISLTACGWQPIRSIRARRANASTPLWPSHKLKAILLSDSSQRVALSRLVLSNCIMLLNIYEILEQPETGIREDRLGVELHPLYLELPV